MTSNIRTLGDNILRQNCEKRLENPRSCGKVKDKQGEEKNGQDFFGWKIDAMETL